MWCEIENHEEWQRGYEIIATFGDIYYVLASNKPDEAMVHGVGTRQWKLTSARATQDRTGRRAIGFTLDEKGGKIFGTVTSKNMQRPLCILLDGMAISSPNIQARITTDGIITGTFMQKEQQDMVDKLNAGSLPAKLKDPPILEKTIGPSIGAVNRDKGIRAGLIGFCVVAVCMLVYYTLAGLVANIALCLNLLFILAIMALVKATFTLPGIAGMILTIGMSVDANVLIFERIREEQRRGSSLAIAIRNGYQKAFRTIIDANITTFITAAILYWVASEEIKGFAIVLMLGIASSMFTALFVTRVIFNWLLAKRLIKDHLVMLQLVRKPNINWMGLRRVFMTISTLLIVAGLVVFFTSSGKYDIEFTGGTSVQINLKEVSTRQQVEDKFQEAAAGNRALAAANIYSIGKSGKQYEINTTETNKSLTAVTLQSANQKTSAEITAAIEETGLSLNGLVIVQDSQNAALFTVSTSQLNKKIVKNALSKAFPDAVISEPSVEPVVSNAVLDAFGDDLEIQRNLEPQIVSQEKVTEELIDFYPELVDFTGGLKITCKLEKPATIDEIDERLSSLRFKPDRQNLKWYYYKVYPDDLSNPEPDKQVNSFVYISVEPEAAYRQLDENEWNSFVENEKTKVLAAASLAGSLPRVTQIDPSVGSESKTRALIAIILSLFAIVAYVWVRFGSVRYGMAANIALVHDVCITLGAVTACGYIATTSLGKMLLIGDFKIDLAMIAAFLTLIGYSLNDTIVIFDRIRENRRKAQLIPMTITNSINQTISRTLLTSLTTFIVVFIMYIFGGEALRGFTFAIGLGVIVGTYSSIAIAAPVLLIAAKVKNKTSK